MIELQQFIVSELKKVHPRVYLEWAPEGAEFPYVVYRFPNSTPTKSYREDTILEIDVWDQPPDGSTVRLETLCKDIHQALNRLIHNAPGWITRIYLANRLMVPDPNPTIRRRQLRYELRTTDVGGLI